MVALQTPPQASTAVAHKNIYSYENQLVFYQSVDPIRLLLLLNFKDFLIFINLVKQYFYMDLVFFRLTKSSQIKTISYNSLWMSIPWQLRFHDHQL